jgi:hypothetical protein
MNGNGIKPPAVFETPQFRRGERVYWWVERKGKLRMTGIVKFQEGQFVRVEIVTAAVKGRKNHATTREVNVLADELQRVY